MFMVQFVIVLKSSFLGYVILAYQADFKVRMFGVKMPINRRIYSFSLLMILLISNNALLDFLMNLGGPTKRP